MKVNYRSVMESDFFILTSRVTSSDLLSHWHEVNLTKRNIVLPSIFVPVCGEIGVIEGDTRANHVNKGEPLMSKASLNKGNKLLFIPRK